MNLDELDSLFSALASRERRRMLDLLQAKPGLTVAALAQHFDMSSVGVLKHVKVLEAANLVLAHKVGRERKLFLNLMPIQQVYDRWTDEYSRFWGGHVADLKAKLEAHAAGKAGAARKAQRHA
ncbi:MAG: helix-turn-helix transcriptional regulator [Tepidisphaera sp.]|jgi:DNA-binding transcriptional ArsR family regulator